MEINVLKLEISQKIYQNGANKIAIYCFVLYAQFHRNITRGSFEKHY